MKITALLFLLVYMAACTDGLKDYSQLEGLRVLGVVADQPEINGPGAVSLIPFVSFPEASDSTTLRITYEACLDPGTAQGAEPNCADSSFLIEPPTSYTVSLSDLGAASRYTGAVSPFTVNIPPLPLDEFANFLTFNGLDVLVFMTVTNLNNPDQSTETIKRISVTSKEDGLNNNPSFAGFQTSPDSQPVGTLPSQPADFSLSMPSTAESYRQQLIGGPIETLTEVLTVSWFTTGGSWENSRTEAGGINEFDPEDSTGVTIVAVLRDDRGGLSVQILNLD